MSTPFIAELSRRNVFKVAFVYIVGAALLYWLAGLAQTQLELPWWFSRLVGILFVVGFVPALMFAWVYEITPHGLKKAVDVDPLERRGEETHRGHLRSSAADPVPHR